MLWTCDVTIAYRMCVFLCSTLQIQRICCILLSSILWFFYSPEVCGPLMTDLEKPTWFSKLPLGHNLPIGRQAQNRRKADHWDEIWFLGPVLPFNSHMISVNNYPIRHSILFMNELIKLDHFLELYTLLFSTPCAFALHFANIIELTEQIFTNIKGCCWL